MSGRTVIVRYRPKPGREDDLIGAIRDHLQVLRAEGLATDRPHFVMRASDGSYLEVFEWESAAAIERAHGNPAVGALWARFDAACEYGVLVDLAEASDIFAEFESVALRPPTR